jgi:hypothetical protein
LFSDNNKSSDRVSCQTFIKPVAQEQNGFVFLYIKLEVIWPNDHFNALLFQTKSERRYFEVFVLTIISIYVIVMITGVLTSSFGLCRIYSVESSFESVEEVGRKNNNFASCHGSCVTSKEDEEKFRRGNLLI